MCEAVLYRIENAVTMIDTAKIGRKGGKARVANMSAEALSEANRSAVEARWARYYAKNPDKLKLKQEREAQAQKKKRARAKKRP